MYSTVHTVHYTTVQYTTVQITFCNVKIDEMMTYGNLVKYGVHYLRTRYLKENAHV